MFTVTEEAAVGQFYALISPPGGSVLRAHFHLVDAPDRLAPHHLGDGRAAAFGQPADAEQLADVALAVDDVVASGRVPQQRRRLLEVLQPAGILLVLDRDPSGVDLPL